METLAEGVVDLEEVNVSVSHQNLMVNMSPLEGIRSEVTSCNTP